MKMDTKQMKVLLERYGRLKIRIENSQNKIRRIRAYSFEEYIEEKTYRSPLGERRLQGANHPIQRKHWGSTGAGSSSGSATHSCVRNSSDCGKCRHCCGRWTA